MPHRAERQIVLDTETTGLSPEEGHRILEIGAVELINLHPTGVTFQRYLNPERDIPEESVRIHGITSEKVAGCPRFWEVADELLAFLGGDPLVIHNAAFDMAFLNHELAQAGRPPLEGQPVVDTLAEAKRRHPRQRNSLDALCRRYNVDNAHRTLHGALLDAEILADVYVAMLGGHQTWLMGLEKEWGEAASAGEGSAEGAAEAAHTLLPPGACLPAGRRPLLARATEEELRAHAALLGRLGEACIWRDAAAGGA
jgi:DNA polymerase-3 subunit epsilon